MLDSVSSFCYNVYIELRKREKTMNLKECITCGSHEFKGNKCAYCGNVYEVDEQEKDDKLVYYDERPTFTTEEEIEKPAFIEAFEIANEHDAFMVKSLVVILGSIIWFAITVFIPPLFILTICGLIIWACKRLIKKGEKK